MSDKRMLGRVRARMSRCLSVIVTLSMVLSLVPTSAVAEMQEQLSASGAPSVEESGQGTAVATEGSQAAAPVEVQATAPVEEQAADLIAEQAPAPTEVQASAPTDEQVAEPTEETSAESTPEASPAAAPADESAADSAPAGESGAEPAVAPTSAAEPTTTTESKDASAADAATTAPGASDKKADAQTDAAKDTQPSAGGAAQTQESQASKADPADASASDASGSKPGTQADADKAGSKKTDATKSDPAAKTPEAASDQAQANTKSTLVYEDEQVKVTAELADPSVLPAGVELKVTPVDTGDAGYQEYLSALNEGAAESDTYNPKNTLLYDVAFFVHDKDGKVVEVEPAQGSVKVTFDFKQHQLTDRLGAEKADDVAVTHLPEAEGTIEVEEVSQTTGVGSEQIQMTVDSFSVYAFSYTVDFTYDGFTYSIAGESDILLSELFAILGINESAVDVQEVTFSDPSLVAVDQLEGDWLLTSLAPFSSKETLNVKLFNGGKYVIDVTDAQTYTARVEFYGFDGTTQEPYAGHDQGFYVYAELKDSNDNIIGWYRQEFAQQSDQSTHTVTFEKFKDPSHNKVQFDNPTVQYDSAQGHTVSVRLYRKADGHKAPDYHLLHDTNLQEYELREMPDDTFDGYKFITNDTTSESCTSIVKLKRWNGSHLYIHLDFNPGKTTEITADDNYWIRGELLHQSGSKTYFAKKLTSNDLTIEANEWREGQNGNVLTNEQFTGNEVSFSVKIYKTAPGQNPNEGHVVKEDPNTLVPLAEGSTVNNYKLSLPDPTISVSEHTTDDLENYKTRCDYSIKLTEINAKKDYTYGEILGDGKYYGITAEKFIKEKHAQTNFAVNHYQTDGSVNIDPDLSGSSAGVIAIAEFDNNSKLFLGTSHAGDKVVVIYDETVDNPLKDPRDFVTLVPMNREYIKNSIVEPIIQHGDNVSAELLGHPATIVPPIPSNSNYAVIIDTTAFAADATIYIDADPIASYFNNSKIKINKHEDQMIVFNFDETSTVNIEEIEFKYFGETQYTKTAGSTAQDTTNTRLNKYCQHVVYNLASVTAANLSKAAGIFLMPNEDSILDVKGTSTGWILSDGTVTNTGDEWHFPWAEMPPISTAKGSLSITKDITINGQPVNAANKTLANGTFKFKVKGPGDGGVEQTVLVAVTDGIAETKTLNDLDPGLYTITEDTNSLPGGMTVASQNPVKRMVGLNANEKSFEFTAAVTNDIASSTISGSTQLSAHKTVSGDDYEGDEDFTFTLAKAERTPDEKNSDVLPSVTTVSAKKDNDATFGAITYTEEGTYYYTITETQGTTSGMTYVTEPRYAKVVVNKSADNESLVATATYGATKADCDKEHAATSLTITNAYAKPTTDTVTVSGTKTWKDGSIAHNDNANEVQLVLKRRTSTAETFTTVEGATPTWNGDTYTFSGLDKADGDGKIYEYEVDETAPTGFTPTKKVENGQFNFTNTRSGTIEVTGTKTWNDGGLTHNNAAEITLTLKRKSAKPESTEHVVDATAEWNGNTYKFVNLPEYDGDGYKYTYTVEEAAIEGYDSAKNGNNFTNTRKGTTQVTGTKTWLDGNASHNNQTDVTLRLERKTAAEETYTYVDGFTVSWQGNTYTIPGLDKYDAQGREYTYRVSENDKEGYTWSRVEGTNNLVNKSTAKVSVKVNKVWDDGDNQDNARPDKVTVRLHANGAATRDKVELSDGQWAHTWDNLDKFDDEGKAIVYTVSEDEVENYSTEITPNSENDYTITNKYTPGQTSVTVSKVWLDGDNAKGNRPASVNVQLKANGIDYGNAITLTGPTWGYTWSGLPEKDNGTEIQYTVVEVQIGGETDYKSTTTGSAQEGFTITNALNKTIDIEGSKTWVDGNKTHNNANDVTLTLKRKSAKTGSTEVAVTDKQVAWNGNNYTYSGLPKYDPEGFEYTYTVEEAAIEGYTSKKEGNDFTNQASGTTSVTGTKTWVDGGKAHDNTTEVHLTLKRLSKKYDDPVAAEHVETLGDARPTWNGNTYTFAGLAKYDAEGYEYTYTVAEQPIAGYDTEQTGNNFTNTYLEGEATLSVEKLVVGDAGAPADEEFSFTLSKAPGSTATTDTLHGNTAKAKAGAKATFGTITYTEAGTYYYAITETPGTTENMTYDSAPVYAKVVVERDKSEGAKHSLKATVTYGATPETCTSATATITNTFAKPAIEKYVNKDVHSDLAAFDTPFDYDILAYVTTDADKVVITDTLVDGIKFVSTDAKVAVSDLGESNDHTADGTVAAPGEAVQASTTISGKTITATIDDATSLRGHWVNVHFQAMLDNAVVGNWAQYENNKTSATSNGAVQSTTYAEGHEGVANTASYQVYVKPGEEMPSQPTYSKESNTVTVTPGKTKVSVSKVAVGGGKEIAGATIELLAENKDGELEVVKLDEEEVTWNSEEGRTHDIVGLNPGTYVLHETVAPAGYQVATDITFTLKADGTIETVARTSDAGAILIEDALTKVTISKTDITGETELDGAKLEIRDSTGTNVVNLNNVDLTHTSKAGEPWVVEGLKPGTYTLVETTAPDGYAVTAATTFTIDNQGKVTATGTSTTDADGNVVILIEDALTKVVVSKRDATGGDQELQGAKIQILDKDGEVVTTVKGEKLEWTSGTEPKVIEGLKTGVEYTLHEEVAPLGYTVATDSTFTIGEDGKVTAKGAKTFDADGNTVILIEDSMAKPALEKYINKDVHQDLPAFDTPFTYDILAYVTADADYVEITDGLVKGVRFLRGVNTTVTVQDIGPTNDHKAHGTVEVAKGTDVKEIVGEEPGIDIAGKKLTVTIPDATNLRGHWVRVTYDVALDNTQVSNSSDYQHNDKEIADNGTVISKAYPNGTAAEPSHDGVETNASYKVLAYKRDAQGQLVMGADNKPLAKTYSLDANYITVTPTTQTVTVKKLWNDATGKAVTWPKGATVTLELLGNGKPLDEATTKLLGMEKAIARQVVTLTADKPSATFADLPIYDALTYSVAETAVTGVTDGMTTTVTGSAQDGFTVTNAVTSVTISKVDIVSGEELEGAHIQILDASGAVVEEWNSTKEPHLITGLHAGVTYTLRETVAPLGYDIASDTTFTLAADGSIDAAKTTAARDAKTGALLIKDTVAQPALEKYINKDVHQDLPAFDTPFTYDILAYVTKDADKVVIRDQLVRGVRFLKGAKTTVAVQDIGPVNDHTAHGTVEQAKGETIASAVPNIDGKTLTVTIPDAEKEKLRGHWVRVTYQVALDNAEVSNSSDYQQNNKEIDANGTVISERYPNGTADKPSHDGVETTASYEIIVYERDEQGQIKTDAAGERIVAKTYPLSANYITVTPPTMSVAVTKVWKDADGKELAWPAGAKVTVQLLGNGKPLSQATAEVLGAEKAIADQTLTLTADKPSASFAELPIYDAITYSVAESSVTGVPSGYQTTISGSVKDGFVVTNTMVRKDTKPTSQDETAPDKDKSTPATQNKNNAAQQNKTTTTQNKTNTLPTTTTRTTGATTTTGTLAKTGDPLAAVQAIAVAMGTGAIALIGTGLRRIHRRRDDDQ